MLLSNLKTLTFRRQFFCGIVAISATCLPAYAQDLDEDENVRIVTEEEAKAAQAQENPNAVELVEDLASTRVMDVKARVSLSGLFFTAGTESAVKMKVESGAAFFFQERFLKTSGVGADAYRSYRSYTGAEANKIVDTRKTNTKLNGSLARLVAQAEPGGINFHSNSHHMSREDLDLLRMPGDTLPALGLLPAGKVEKGDTWKPPLWSAQSICGIEAMLKNDIQCQLVSFTDTQASVSFAGSVRGAGYGATAEIKLKGSFTFDRTINAIDHFEMTHSEKRSVGSVSPGMDVVAKIKWDRMAALKSRISDKNVAEVPLIPDPETDMLSFTTPWGVSFLHDRSWHIFHKTPELCILRLVESGSLVAQANITKVIDANPGESTSEKTFQQDIRESLGARLKKIESAALIKTGDDRRIYQVIANGKVNKRPMNWRYYLCTDASGKQTAFVFTVGDDQLQKLAKRDQSVVTSAKFSKVGKIARSPR